MGRFKDWFTGSDIEQKALSQGHPSQFQGPWFNYPLQTYTGLREIGDGSQNSAVTACLITLAAGIAEAPLRVWETNEGDIDPLYGHPAAQLWARPNQYMTEDLLAWYITWAVHVQGNAYIVKARNVFGEVIELWPLLPHLVTPKTFNDVGFGSPTNGFIDFYEYDPDGRIRIIPVEDVIHIKLGFNANNHRLGYAPLEPVLKEILGDEEASRFSTALLRNMGVPGVVLSPDQQGDPGPSQEEAERIKEMYSQKFGGERRGEPLVLTGRMKVDVVSWSPQQMDLRDLRRLPEERISAVLGVPAILAGLGAGLDRSTFANMDEAGEHFTERKLVPFWRTIEKQVSAQLGPDLGLTDDEFFQFDLQKIRALSEEKEKLWLRIDRSVRSGWVTVADARRMVGLPNTPADDIYLRPIVTAAVPAGLTITEITVPQSLPDQDEAGILSLNGNSA